MKTREMKTIGLVGGIVWPSTIEYYRLLNSGVNAALGKHNFCKCIVYSLNFQEIQDNNASQDWDATYELLLAACQNLVKAGADAVLICANTMHFAADKIRAHLPVPLIHIAEVTGASIVSQGIKTVALLGTRYTMEMDFYQNKLKALGISVFIPSEEDREFIHSTIYNELSFGVLLPETKKKYQTIIENMARMGAEAVILGCTEIPLLIQENDVSIPVFDTTKIHAEAAVKFVLG